MKINRQQLIDKLSNRIAEAKDAEYDSFLKWKSDQIDYLNRGINNIQSDIDKITNTMTIDGGRKIGFYGNKNLIESLEREVRILQLSSDEYITVSTKSKILDYI